MPYPLMDLSHLLVAAPLDTPLRVRDISLEPARALCAALGVCVGDEIRNLGMTEHGVFVETPVARELFLELGLAVCVEVDQPVATP